MKSLRFSVSVARLAIGALLLVGTVGSLHAKEKGAAKGSAIFASSPADGGRLIIKRSPVLGQNVRVTVTIDGKRIETLTRNRTFDRYLKPGRHVLVAGAD